MASKQAKAKEIQGWTKDFPCCENCEYFKSTVENFSNAYGTFPKSRNMKCSVGGFATKKRCWCKKWERRVK